MKMIQHIFNSSLGKKYIMAVSGVVLFLFVLGHLAGNLQIFFGPGVINHYGHFLQTNPELIWPARITLLLMVGLHIWSAARLTLENRAARPIRYGEYTPAAASYASRTMFISGLIIFSFIVYHLLHFTFRTPQVNLTGEDFAVMKYTTAIGEQQNDIYKMMLTGFSNIWVVLFYGIGVGLLCFHLSHGISAMFQSLGWKNEGWRPFIDKAARVIAVLIFLGYMSIPVAVQLKVLKFH